MTVYYISPYGSDANAGTGPLYNQAWLTIGKALGAAGAAAGDTLQVCPGVYRETITVAMTTGAVTTINGDVGNVQGFKDGAGVLVPGGEVRFTPPATNDFVGPAGSNLSSGGKSALTFNNIVWYMVAATAMIGSSGALTQNYIFNDNAFIMTANNTPFGFTVTVDQALHWTFNRCHFYEAGTSTFIAITAPTSTVADYDVDVVLNDCINYTAEVFTSLTGTGANSFKPYGIKIYNCTSYGRLMTAGALCSLANPSLVYNCLQTGQGTGFVNANTTGMIVEDYNSISGSRTNVPIGAHSVTYPNYFHFGQERIWGGSPRPFMSPTWDSPLLGFGAQAGGPTVDILNRPRPAGVHSVATGTATSGAAKTLTNTAAGWPTNGFAGYTIQITAGTGSGQTKSIASNTGTVITVDGNWKTNPANDSVYQVYWGDLSSTGTATAGSTTTLTDGNAAWGVNQWTGYTCHIDSGTSSGSSFVVTSNTATVLTFPAGTAPDATSTYSLYKATGVTTQDYAVGAFERHDTAVLDSVTYDVSPSSWQLVGVADQQIQIPVDAVSTTISIRNRFDTAHGTGSPPDVLLVANGEIGVTTQTVAAAANANTWQTISLAAITPTAKGVVTLYLRAHAAASNGLCWFDTVSVV